MSAGSAWKRGDLRPQGMSVRWCRKQENRFMRRWRRDIKRQTGLHDFCYRSGQWFLEYDEWLERRPVIVIG